VWPIWNSNPVREETFSYLCRSCWSRRKASADRQGNLLGTHIVRPDSR
jgi:hypothetical protein